MNKIVGLKDAVHQLEVDVAALTEAERGVANWSELDRTRRDGSSAQDERHESLGQEARERAWQAKQKVNSQKDRIAQLTKAI